MTGLGSVTLADTGWAVTAADATTLTLTNGAATLIANKGQVTPAETMAPFAGDDDVSTDRATATSIAFATLLTNDGDANAADVVSVTAAGAAATGLVTFDGANNEIDYDPNGAFGVLAQGQTAADSFTYDISDGAGGTDTATVMVTITSEIENASSGNDVITGTGADETIDGGFGDDTHPALAGRTSSAARVASIPRMAATGRIRCSAWPATTF